MVETRVRFYEGEEKSGGVGRAGEGAMEGETAPQPPRGLEAKVERFSVVLLPMMSLKMEEEENGGDGSGLIEKEMMVTVQK